MPQHATKTSFRPGHKRSQESIDKQRATLKEQYANGELVLPRPVWDAERKETHARERRQAALGNRYDQGEYIRVMTLDGPKYEHRVVMERVLGRPLAAHEVVHHKNRDTRDNRPENLEVMSHGEHHREHYAEGTRVAPKGPRIPEGYWTKTLKGCVRCGRSDVQHAAKGVCKTCYMREKRGG